MTTPKERIGRMVEQAPKVPARAARGNGAADVYEPDIDATRVDAETLVQMNLAEPLYVARPWISEGVALVVGRPKIGKTTLLRQLVAAINNEGEFLTARCSKATVLFLSLEENQRLMRQKLLSMRLPGGALAG